MTIKKPDLGTDYSGIETIKKYVKEMQADYENSYNEDILGYVLWILDDYKRLKQGDGTNFSRITKTPEALAEFIADTCYGLFDDVWANDGDTSCDYPETEKNYWLAWLKQPHTTE